MEIHGQHDCRLCCSLDAISSCSTITTASGTRADGGGLGASSRRVSQAELDRLVRDEQARLRRLDLLDFQAADIDAINPFVMKKPS